MKKLIFLIAMLMICNCLFAQTKKVYLTKSGKYTANSEKSVAYILVSRLNNDSAFLATKYDMNNNLIFRGTFKDEALTIPIGKFMLYKTTLNTDAKFKSDITVLNNGINYIAMDGYYTDGKKTGIWYEFSPKGDVIAKYNYENDVLNGSYEMYNPSEGYHGIGNTVNGKLQGDFKVYNTENLLTEELIYNKGKIQHKTEYFKDAKENVDLEWHIERELRKYMPVMYDSQFTMTYTIDKNGNITNPQIVSGYDSRINQTLLAAVNNYNGYKPALYNNVPVDQKVTRTFQIFESAAGSGSESNHNPPVAGIYTYHDITATNPGASYK
jgi:antitoxin component YwqK of YwqJK toxin-antitoxin module